MKKLNFLFFLLLLLPQEIFCQESYTSLQTNSGEVKIPGEWQQLNTAEDSGQTYLKNSDNVIIAIAKNPKRAYPFYAKEKSDFENVIAFYKWDADYRESLNSKTQKLKEIIAICKDYSKLKKEDKEVVKDSYFFARYIQILCTTNYYKYYLDNYFHIYASIEDELQSRFWFSFKIYIKKIFKI